MQSNLTIVIADTSYHTLAARALDQALSVTHAKNILVLSDQDFYPGAQFVKIDPIQDKNDYSLTMIKEVGKHITTDHFLIIQYDGMPTDGTKWTDEFLNYDYIGAVWPWRPEGTNVGNGGFSLRSRRLAELCLDHKFTIKYPLIEDVAICLENKQWLEQQGVKYAPSQLASQFSMENPGGLYPSYGFHGTLCLPFYLSDKHLAAYIDNLTPSMLRDPIHIRTLYGLFRAQRYEHLEMFMDRATVQVPDFKEILLAQLPGDTQFFPGMTVSDLSDLLINY